MPSLVKTLLKRNESLVKLKRTTGFFYNQQIKGALLRRTDYSAATDTRRWKGLLTWPISSAAFGNKRGGDNSSLAHAGESYERDPR